MDKNNHSQKNKPTSAHTRHNVSVSASTAHSPKNTDPHTNTNITERSLPF
jgi:hypothetical protein